jgi:hypothetical protein
MNQGAVWSRIQGGLPVGVYHPCGLAVALRLDRQMRGEHGFAAAALLRFDDYCFHEIQPFNKAWFAER